MRTTLTLEPDVATMLKKAVASGNRNFKDVVNAALRAGLAAMDPTVKPKKRFVQRTKDFGPVPSPDEIREILLKQDLEPFLASS